MSYDSKCYDLACDFLEGVCGRVMGMSDRNMPTPEGRIIGDILARVTESTLGELRAKFPNHRDDRCKSCAFRPDTFPNGCLETVMDAIVCTTKVEPFFCHMHFDASDRPTHMCDGWLIALASSEKLNALLDDFPQFKAILDQWDVHRNRAA